MMWPLLRIVAGLALVVQEAPGFVAFPQQQQQQHQRRSVARWAVEAGIQFYPGTWEPNVPDVKLTRSRDAETGVATFVFSAPSFFNIEKEEDVPKEAITAMTMIDEEGEISTVKVNAKFVNGKPSSIEAKYEMFSPAEWDRFLRFMNRYADANDLGFNKA